MLSMMEEYYKVTCTDCDWIVYSEVDDDGLPYEIIERSNERITVKVRYPSGMDEAASRNMDNCEAEWPVENE